MPTEIILIAVLILLLISIVLNISTYFKIEKEKNLILEKLSNNSINISQIDSNIQQIQKDLKNVKGDLEEVKRQTYSSFQHFETLINENRNEFKTELSKLHTDILINIESKHKSMDEKVIENYKKIQELEKKIEHIIKLLKEPLTEEDLR